MTAMATTKAARNKARRVTGEHLQLRERATHLRSMLASPPNESDRLVWLGHLCLDLSDFIDRVARHFEIEETEGPFDDIKLQRPELLAEVRRLQNDHRTIIVGFDRVRATLGITPIAQVAERVLELIDQLEAHEAAESRLQLAAWTDDMGTSG